MHCMSPSYMGKYKKEDLKVVHKKLHFMFFEQKYKYY